MLYDIIIVIAALAVLLKASDYFVDAAAKLARVFGVPDFIVGVTLVAIGTSLPEFVSSIAASFYQNSQLVYGPIIGSNIARIGLVLGISAVIAPIMIKKRIFSKEGMFLLAVSLLFAGFALNSEISRIEGIILLLLFIAYMLWLIETDVLKNGITRFFRNVGMVGLYESVRIFRTEIKVQRDNIAKVSFGFIAKHSGIAVASCFVLYFSAKYLIPSLESIASGLRIPDTVIGVLVLGIGTSLPELLVCISAAKKGMGSMIMGTIIGSNIADTLLVLGVSSIIYPITLSFIGIAYYLPVMLFMTLMLIAFIRTSWIVRMLEGFLLLLFYAMFLFFLFFFF